MTEKKRQHYVPVFYLKLFSDDAEQRRISLFHLGAQRLIPNVSIKRQAYKDNFYGSDKIFDSVFESLENRSSEVLSEIISKNNHPRYYSKEHHVMLTFAMMLHARTLYSAETLDEFWDHIFKTALSRNRDYKNYPEETEIRFHNSAQMVVQCVASGIHIVADLGYKLLINKTATPFITSYHPVVFYNQFLENRRTWGSNTGFASKGLQVFLPISPRHQLFFYDQDVYKVSGYFHKPICLKDQEDIDSLNGLQLLNAHTNLYFNLAVSSEYIKSLFSRFSPHRRTAKLDTEEFYSEPNENGSNQSMILHMYQQDIRCGFSLSCITLTKKAKRFKLDNRAIYVRDETIYRIDAEFTSLVRAGVYKYGEFKRFFKDKYGSRFEK